MCAADLVRMQQVFVQAVEFGIGEVDVFAYSVADGDVSRQQVLELLLVVGVPAGVGPSCRLRPSLARRLVAGAVLTQSSSMTGLE